MCTVFTLFFVVRVHIEVLPIVVPAPEPAPELSPGVSCDDLGMVSACKEYVAQRGSITSTPGMCCAQYA